MVVVYHIEWRNFADSIMVVVWHIGRNKVEHLKALCHHTGCCWTSVARLLYNYTNIVMSFCCIPYYILAMNIVYEYIPAESIITKPLFLLLKTYNFVGFY